MNVLRVSSRRAAREHHRAPGHDEAAHHLTGARVPEPVADLGVERIDLVAAPRGHPVVEAVEALTPVVDRTERIEHRALAVGRVADLVRGVVERDVETVGAFPCSDEPGERAEIQGVGVGTMSSTR